MTGPMSRFIKSLGYKPSDRFFLGVRHKPPFTAMYVVNKKWENMRAEIAVRKQHGETGWVFFLVGELYGVYSITESATDKIDVYPADQYELAVSLGVATEKLTPRPEWALKNPFAHCSMGSWVAANDVVSQQDRVKDFDLQECRWALAMPDCKKTTQKACLSRIKALYTHDGSLYPTPPDTLAFVRRIAQQEEFPLHFNRLCRFVCEQAGCVVDSVEGERHRKHFLTLYAEGYVQQDEGNFVTFTEPTRSDQNQLTADQLTQ